MLNLSHNRITKIQNLPPNLKELNLTNNQISEIKYLTPLKSLIHLGLSYNQISNQNVPLIVRNFPSLFCLDLQHNTLCDLSHSIQFFQKLENLRLLYLAGNPLALTYRYREILKENLQELRFIDGTPAFTEVEESLKKKMRKRFLKQEQLIPGGVFQFVKECDRIKIRDLLSFEIQIRAL